MNVSPSAMGEAERRSTMAASYVCRSRQEAAWSRSVAIVREGAVLAVSVVGGPSGSW